MSPKVMVNSGLVMLVVSSVGCAPLSAAGVGGVGDGVGLEAVFGVSAEAVVGFGRIVVG